MAQEIYHRSNWGIASNEWGSTYLNADLTNELYKRAGYYENSWATDKILNKIGTKPSIILTPTAYEDGVLNSVKPSNPFGSELVINGSFETDSDWTKGSGWSIADGKAYYSGITNSDLAQSGILTSGKLYKLQYEVINSTLVNGVVKLSGTTASAQNVLSQTVGTHTLYFTADGTIPTSFNIRIVLNISGQFELDNVSVKEVLHADFDFTRGSSATRVNEKGLIQDVQILSDELVQNGDFEQVGSELVTNGGFDTDSDWSKTNATISGGKATITVVSGAYSLISQSTTYQNGRIYKLTAQVQGTSGKACTFFDNGSNTGGLNLSNGIVNFDGSLQNVNITFTANSNSNQLLIVRNGGGDYSFTIDNVSVKEVGQNWTITSGATIEDGQLVLSASANLYQSIPLTVGKKYRVKYEITSIDAGSSGITVYGGSTSGTRREEVGTYTEDIIQSGSGLLFFFTGGGFNSGTIDNVSVVEVTDDTDLPRIDYTDGEGSLLLEPSRTNYLLQSNQFDTTWVKSSDLNLTGGQSGVFGSNDAWLLKKAATGKKSVQQYLSLSSAQYSYSVYLKAESTNWAQIWAYDGAASVNAYFDLENGVVGQTNGSSLNGTKIESVGNGWYRCTLIYTHAENLIRIYPANSNGDTINGADNGIYIQYAQLEQGSYPTSYIPTNGTTVTRLADEANNAGNSDLINSTEGVLYAEISALADDGTSRSISLSDGTYNNSLILQYRSISNTISIKKFVTLLSTFTVPSTKDYIKIAISYSSNIIKIYLNGLLIDTNNTFTSFPSNTLNRLNFNRSDGGETFYANVKSVAVFKEALSDEELHKLTSPYESFEQRVKADGGDIESLNCIPRIYR